MHAREQYWNEVRKEYERTERAGRQRLLDEAEKRTKLNRKYLIRRMGEAPREANQVRRRWRRRARKYGAAVVTALVQIWETFEFPCGQRLESILKREVGRLRKLGELRCSDEVARKLGEVSGKTIDRLLEREKRVRQLKRERNPSAHLGRHQQSRVESRRA